MLLIKLPTQSVFAGFSNPPTCLTDLNAFLKPSIWHTNYNSILMTGSGMVWLNFLRMTLISLKPERVLWPMILACTVLNSRSNCILNVPLRSPEPTWVLNSVVDFYKTMIADRWPTKWWQDKSHRSLYKYNICYLNSSTNYIIELILNLANDLMTTRFIINLT